MAEIVSRSYKTEYRDEGKRIYTVTAFIEVSSLDFSSNDGDGDDLERFAVDNLHDYIDRQSHFRSSKGVVNSEGDEDPEEDLNKIVEQRVQEIINMQGNKIKKVGAGNNCPVHNLPRIIHRNPILGDRQRNDGSENIWESHGRPLIENGEKIWCQNYLTMKDLMERLWSEERAKRNHS